MNVKHKNPSLLIFSNSNFFVTLKRKRVFLCIVFRCFEICGVKQKQFNKVEEGGIILYDKLFW